MNNFYGGGNDFNLNNLLLGGGNLQNFNLDDIYNMQNPGG